MSRIYIPNMQSEPNEFDYTPPFKEYFGYFNENPIYRSIEQTVADACTTSWKVEGSDADKIVKILDNFEGNGKQSFKSILNAMLVVSNVCGDSFAEIIYDGLDVVDLQILPSENMKIVIKNGQIKRYEEASGWLGRNPAKWKPQEILHIMNNPIGSMCHGVGNVKYLKNLLITWKQFEDDLRKIYHSYIKPFHIFYLDEDDDEKIQDFKNEAEKQLEVTGNLYLPKESAEVQRVSIPQGSTLDPSLFAKLLLDEMMMASRVSAQVLGTGSVNSEESARMQMAGFNQLIRIKQKIQLSETIEMQVFPQITGNRKNKIKWSFASEPDEERYNRLMATLNILNQMNLNPQDKGVLELKLLRDMGIVEREL